MRRLGGLMKETHMTIEIRHRYTSLVLYTSDAPTMRAALEEAIKKGANLSGANLSGADLSSAYLSSAYLSSAYLSSADLSGADLSGADLSSADLSSAYLSGAYLSSADLSGADLSGADLSGAYLRRAYLSGANLSGADLSSADLSSAYLTEIRKDVRRVLDAAPAEVPALLDAIRNGRVNGSVYEGECSCLVGTIATAQGVSYRHLAGELAPNEGRPAERFTMGVATGDTPETNPVSLMLETWIVEWQEERA